jgi:hypothetical protein
MTHTTNYINTLIKIADDCSVETAEIPTPKKNGAKTIALYHYEMISQDPYRYTSDDVIFEVYAQRNEISEAGKELARQQFFSKGQPCLRSSPLGKRFGWGIHSDKDGKIALYPVESREYKRLANDDTVVQIKAMRSKRA